VQSRKVPGEAARRNTLHLLRATDWALDVPSGDAFMRAYAAAIKRADPARAEMPSSCWELSFALDPAARQSKSEFGKADGGAVSPPIGL
jgi:hypothetical protein